MKDQEKNKKNDAHYEIFISYAHKDNEVTEGDGWVTMLHKALKIRLDQLRDEESKIWRDEVLQGNEEFGPEIVDVLENADIFVSILTPKYTKSDWCNKELETFVETHKNDKILGNSTNKKRIFKVIKTPVDRSKEPPYFKEVGLLGFPFIKTGSDPPLELYPVWGSKAEKEVTERIDDLARSIASLLENIEGSDVEKQNSKGTVYLADTSKDVAEMRIKLIRELEDHGYTVLPERVLPIRVSEIEVQVQQDLQDALCSIHLIGEHSGFIPEDDVSLRGEERNRSAAEIQVDVASAHSKKQTDFFQLIWLSDIKESDLVHITDKQKEFRERISNLEIQGKDDVLQNSFQDFKDEVRAKLVSLQSAQSKTAPGDHAAESTIYLLYTQEDRTEVKALRQYLKKNGYEIYKPVFDGDKEKIDKIHHERLAQADGVLLFWGAGDAVWFESNCDDVREQLSTNSTGKLKSVGIVLSAPENEDKEEFLEDNSESCMAKLIESYGGFSPEDLQKFLDPLNKNEKA